MKYIGLLSVILTGLLLVLAEADFPQWGDPNSPANSYLSTHYITRTMEETAVPNMVTSVLADYRSFDTMLETSVVFVAGIAIFAILRTPRRRRKRTRPRAGARSGQPPEERDLIIRTTSRMLLPPIQLFALYVVAHGHHSPGGGFQGGVIMAASLILVSLSFSLKGILQAFSEKAGLVLGSAGVLIYAGVGVLCILLGSQFLDYSVLEAVYPGADSVTARSHSMLVVEIGVGLTVMSILFLIYANLASHGDFEEGL